MIHLLIFTNQPFSMGQENPSLTSISKLLLLNQFFSPTLSPHNTHTCAPRNVQYPSLQFPSLHVSVIRMRHIEIIMFYFCQHFAIRFNGHPSFTALQPGKSMSSTRVRTAGVARLNQRVRNEPRL